MNRPEPNRDPLTVLRAVDDRPVDPRPAFTRALRTRLQRGAGLREDIAMTVDLTDPSPQTPTAPVVERPGALPYLAVADARAAIDWYVAHLGASLRGTPITMDDGRIGHAELEIGGGVVYLAEAFAEIGLAPPAPGAVSVSLMTAVGDTDRAVAAARDGGARVQREPYDAHGTRTGVVIDPFGHRWMLSGPPAALPETVRRGDVGYVSLWTPDADRAAAFYGAVLGWEYDRTTGQVTNLSHRLGLAQAPQKRTLFLAYAVDDLDTARTAVRAAGGEIPANRGGRHGAVDCVDDTGVEFAVYVPDTDEPRGAQNPSGHGDLTYVTLFVPDSARVRAFYGDVLGWEFAPGHVDDGWEVRDSRPMTGIAGGASGYEAVAMWAVADIDAAVRRVVAAGGEVLDGPTRQPYALSAECRDDQGVRFYLGQY